MSNRETIYYWKCDRQSVLQPFRNTTKGGQEVDINSSVSTVLNKVFGSVPYSFRPLNSQGNHITYMIQSAGETFLLRIENGPEGDKYMEIETLILDIVRSVGVPTPKVYEFDVSRRNAPFSYQIMEYIHAKDLNILWKNEKIDLKDFGFTIGSYIAKWQQIQPSGFGLFNQEILSIENSLIGLHRTYQDYFMLNWNKHLDYLLKSTFITKADHHEINYLVEVHMSSLQLAKGVLVHKDLALWNILGTESTVKSFIDWDDAISGDPTDDISLLACFHSSEFIDNVLMGYKFVKDLPENFLIRFWLHLLRNMIVKAVIRIHFGYFNRDQSFFLVGRGESGESLKSSTKRRIKLACEGLKHKATISSL
ncbi:aminoglycoside phosphotransferase family protein [Spirosoma areae]